MYYAVNELTTISKIMEEFSNGVHLHDRLESTECLGYVSLG